MASLNSLSWAGLLQLMETQVGTEPAQAQAQPRRQASNDNTPPVLLYDFDRLGELEDLCGFLLFLVLVGLT